MSAFGLSVFAPTRLEMARVGRSRRSETPKSDLSANVFTLRRHSH